MPSRKQRKRVQKGRRHEYETVWVDSEGNELDEPPDDLPARPARDPFQLPSFRRRFRGNDGEIDISISGGTSSYTFLWSNGTTD